jgi:Amt family ammonium transporter
MAIEWIEFGKPSALGLATGVCASPALGGSVANISIPSQVGVQVFCAAVAPMLSAVVTVAGLLIARALVGLRVAEADERLGLDLSLHNETAYNQ